MRSGNKVRVSLLFEEVRLMRTTTKGIAILVAVTLVASVASAEGDIDASDPTKIQTFAGPGIKYTSFADGTHLSEIRATGNIGLGEQDMIMFELGYGDFDGPAISGDKTRGLTNARARWFHLFKMDSNITKGYRGWATQIDLQLEGDVVRTSGSNTVAMGALPAFGINEEWSFYLPINYVSTWNSDFKEHTGHGISIAPMAAYAPAVGPWPGFFLQIWPSYTRYFAGDLDGEGAANLDITIGWAPASRWVATAVFQKNFDKNFEGFRRPGVVSGANDWNVFASATYYF